MKKFDLYSFTAKESLTKYHLFWRNPLYKINTKINVKSRSQKNSVLPSAARISRAVKSATVPQNFDQLALCAHKLLNDEHLEISKVRPFFWSLVETYVDRFHIYPFDVNKALFGYLELEACSEEEVQALINKLECLCETKKVAVADVTPRLAAKPAAVKKRSPKLVVSESLPVRLSSLDEGIEGLRACLKYASLVAEV